MRAAFLWIAFTACTPDIAPGSYLCGPEQVCPDDQACDGLTNTCVLPSQVRLFACPTDANEVEPNNAASSAQQVTNLACVSPTAEVIGCSKDQDEEDWFQFNVPATCTTVGVEARLTFPLAFEVLSLELRNDSGAVLSTGDTCLQSEPDDGNEQRCLAMALTPGGRYAIRIARTGEGKCGGACAHNRYTLGIQLETP